MSGIPEPLTRWTDTRKALGVRDAALFCTLQGGPVFDQYVRNALHRLSRQGLAGKRVHPRGLRHTVELPALDG